MIIDGENETGVMSTAPGRKASRRQEALGPLGGGARVLAENQLAGSVELQTQPALQIELRAQDLLQRRDFSMASAEHLLLSLPASLNVHNLKGRPNYVVTFGEHQQGELWVEDTSGLSDSGDLRRRQKPDGALVNGHLLRPRRKVVSFLSPMACDYALGRCTRVALTAHREIASWPSRDIRRLLHDHQFPLGHPGSILFVPEAMLEEPEPSAGILTAEDKEGILAAYEDLDLLLAEDFSQASFPPELWGVEVCCPQPSEL